MSLSQKGFLQALCAAPVRYRMDRLQLQTKRANIVGK